MRIMWAGLLLALLAVPAGAHRDMRFEIGADGTLAGFPSQYGPASMKVTFAASPEGDERPVSSVVLRIGSNETRLPRCVTGLLRTRRLEDVHVSGSWYHDEKILPYYVHIEFKDPEQPGRARDGHALLVDMRTAKVLRMEILSARATLPIDLAELCQGRGSDFLAPRRSGT